MSKLGLETPEELRAELRRKFSTLPAGLEMTSEAMVDLTFHAISEAVAAIDRTASRAPEGMAQLVVLSTAMSMTSHILHNTNASMLGIMIRGATARRTEASE